MVDVPNDLGEMMSAAAATGVAPPPGVAGTASGLQTSDEADVFGGNSPLWGTPVTSNRSKKSLDLQQTGYACELSPSSDALHLRLH